MSGPALVVVSEHFNDPDEPTTEFEHVRQMRCPTCGEEYVHAVEEEFYWYSGYGTDRSYSYDLDDEDDGVPHCHSCGSES